MFPFKKRGCTNCSAINPIEGPPRPERENIETGRYTPIGVHRFAISSLSLNLAVLNGRICSDAKIKLCFKNSV